MEKFILFFLLGVMCLFAVDKSMSKADYTTYPPSESLHLRINKPSSIFKNYNP